MYQIDIDKKILVRSFGKVNPDSCGNWSLAITKDDRYIFVGGIGPYLSKFDIVKQTKVADLIQLSNSLLSTNTGVIFSMELVNDDKEIWFSCSFGNVRVFDLENNRIKYLSKASNGILFASCV